MPAAQLSLFDRVFGGRTAHAPVPVRGQASAPLEDEKPELLFELKVNGVPRPQGSKKDVGNGVMVEASKYVMAWRRKIAKAAKELHAGPEPLITCPVIFDCRFAFKRPKAHYYVRTKSACDLRPEAPRFHTDSPDLSKLLRAVEDALHVPAKVGPRTSNSPILIDDSYIVNYGHSRSVWSPWPSGWEGVHVRIYRATERYAYL